MKEIQILESLSSNLIIVTSQNASPQILLACSLALLPDLLPLLPAQGQTKCTLHLHPRDADPVWALLFAGKGLWLIFPSVGLERRKG